MNALVILTLSLMVKAAVILGLAWGVTRVAGRSSASIRHGVWIAALGAVVALPLAERILPALEVDVPALPLLAREETVARPATPTPTVARGKVVATAASGLAPAGDPFGDLAEAVGDEAAPAPVWPVALLALFAAGAAARLLWLAGQLLRTRLLLDEAVPVRRNDPRRAAADAAARLLRVGRPVRLMVSDRISAPLTSGLLRPAVLLPPASSSWPDARVRVVMLHEIAHVKRADYATWMLTEVACALYWPLPLVWVARAEVRSDQEQASDDLVLGSGASPVDYADHLLAIARAITRRGAPLAGTLGMAREPGLKRRIRRILDRRARRAPLGSAQGALRLAALALCALPVAAMRPVGAGEAPSEPSSPFTTLAAMPAAAPAPAAAADSAELPFVLWMEAEDGALYGATRLGEDLDASGGHFVLVEEEWDDGVAELTFDLPRREEVLVWARIDRDRPGSAALRTTIDGTWAAEVPARGDGWRWVRLAGEEARALPAGPHAIAIRATDGTVRIDRILVTADPGHRPDGRGAAPDGFAPVFRWIESPPTTLREAVDYHVDVPVAGSYVLWGRVMGAHGEANSFLLSVDGAEPVIWDAPRRELGTEGGRWVWDPASARGGDGQQIDPLILELEAGHHTVSLRPREAGTGLAGLLVTNDLGYRPRGRTAGERPVQVTLDPERAPPVTALEVRSGEGALGDGYVEAAGGGPDRADPELFDPLVLDFELPHPGIYTLWARTIAPRDTEDSFWVRVNGGDWMRWNGIPRSESWRWSTVHEGDGGSGTAPLQMALESGENRIEIGRREAGTRLDRLVVTNEETLGRVE